LPSSHIPDFVKKHIYTKNAVESINSGLDYIRRELGGYSPSRQSLDVNYFVQMVNFNDFMDEDANGNDIIKHLRAQANLSYEI
jgi:transposase-like protein